MLEHNTNFDAALDATLKRALPYLIFAPQEFSVKLSGQLGCLWQHFQGQASGRATDFVNTVTAINETIDMAEFDPETMVVISDFMLQRTSYNTRIIRLEQECRELRALIKTMAQKPGEPTQAPSPMPKPRKNKGKHSERVMERLNKLEDYINTTGELTPDDSVRLLGISRSSTQAMLGILVKERLVKIEGHGKLTRYVKDETRLSTGRG
jgi:hypothetical protein